jgi:O-antigen/teichoic acid export membrane protein
MQKALDLRGRHLLNNTAINFLGLGIPYLVGFLAIPFVVRGLGPDRFGLLSILWIIIGYFGFVDLGLGRATTKYVAEFLGKNEKHRVPAYVGSTVWMQLVLGVLGTGILLAAVPWLVEHALKIPLAYWSEARSSLRIIALSLPIVLLSSSFRGILEAAQRFDLVNAVKVPGSILFYLIPLFGVLVGFRLPGIVFLLVLSRAATLGAWMFFCFRILPPLRTPPAFDWGIIKTLLTFGGWVSLSSGLFAIVTSLDRLLIGTLLGTVAVAYYSAPLEAINRLGIIPGSISLTVFPAFSSLDGKSEDRKIRSLYAKSVKYILLSIGLLSVLAFFYSGPFLGLWLGQDFAARSAWVFRILAAGFLISSLAGIPYNFLQGIGRADLAAKLQIVELVTYLALAWPMVRAWGIEGAAVALILKSALVTVLYFAQVSRLRGIGLKDLVENGALRAVLFVLFAALATGLSRLFIPSVILSLGAALVVDGLLGVFFALNKEERCLAGEIMRKALARIAPLREAR